MMIPGLLIIAGFAIDIAFICSEYKGKMLSATILKGIASLMFVILGGFLYSQTPSGTGKLILIGLILGMIGDILLNVRNLVEGALSNKVFALGILSFLSGHFLYMASLINNAGTYSKTGQVVLISVILTAVLGCASIPVFMKRITAPSKGLRIFGYVYLFVVIAMFSFSLSLLIKTGVNKFSCLFAIGALLFVVSDFIMIYYSFGKKIKPLRAINLLSYYMGQILIALCISVLV